MKANIKSVHYFTLKVSTFASFHGIRRYLEEKYTVYTAIFKNGTATFKVVHVIG